MNCRYCGASNREHEHRCARCGRRLAAVDVVRTRSSAVPAPRPAPPPRLQPETGLPPRPAAPQQDSLFAEDQLPQMHFRYRQPQTEKPGGHEPGGPAPATAPSRAPRVIPFDSISRSLRPTVVTEETPHGRPPAARTPPKRHHARAADSRQATLDFLPPPPAAPRTLNTSVEAAVYCDAPVAPRRLRAAAALLDGVVVAIAAGVILSILNYKAGEIPLGRQAMPVYALAITLLFVFYKFLAYLLTGRTPGTAWMGLRVLHFDGRPAGTGLLLLRLVSGCLSVLPAGAGLVWALADEERLSWHDLMSKTFVTTR